MSNRTLEAPTKVDPSWKTAEELKITPAEFVALVALREQLVAGNIKFAAFIPEKKRWFGREPIPSSYCVEAENSLNMRCYTSKENCGTVRCIGGWMHFLMTGSHEAVRYVKHDRSASLRPLFYPPGKYDQYSCDRAAVAIENFLCFGDPKWNFTAV